MSARAYYNEIDPYAAQWLRNLIAAGLIAPGDVDERSVVDVQPDDLRGYTQAHFFAGIGGWSVALRLAGWDDDRPVWTGSCPCQPFSAAGAGKAADDQRHLWPAWFPLIRERRPAIVFGEQVEAAIGWGWFDAVCADLEGEGYACGAAVLPACGVGAPHIRQRLWFVADSTGERYEPHLGSVASAYHPARSESILGVGQFQRGCATRVMADTNGGDASAEGLQRGGEHGQRAQDGRSLQLGDAAGEGLSLRTGIEIHGKNSRRLIERSSHAGELGHAAGGGFGEFGDAPFARGSGYSDGASILNGFWRDAEWINCTDGKARPVGPGSFPLGHGIRRRTSKLRAYGNAIVPQVAAQFIAATQAIETERVES